ncbi:MAG: VPS10 domain-containing protein [Chloroflexota bacterium]
MSRKAFFTLALLVLLLTSSLPASATARQGPPPPEDLHWVFTGGPRGGIGYDLRINPENNDIIWVTDAFAGAHQSMDGGKTWTAKNEGIDARSGLSGDDIPVFSLTIDQHNPDVIWAGVQGMKGVYKSVDGGQTWVKKDNGIQNQPGMEVRGFTIDPSDSNIVYCSGNYPPDPSNEVRVRGFIYKTTDGGETWELLVEPDALVRWVFVDPTDANIVYASTGLFDRFAIKATGVLKSTDGGQTWRQINNGFNNLVVAALAMHPTDPMTLIAGTGKASMFTDEPHEINGGVFITHDGGENWEQVDPIKASGDEEIRFSAVVFAPSNPDIVYADAGYYFLRSQDGGQSWEIFDVGPGLAQKFLENRGQPIALVVHPSNPDILYMNAYDGGMFLSTDGGKTWRDSSVGYTGLETWGLALDPAEPAYIVSASKNGIHLSFDAGGRWDGRIDSGHINNMEAAAIDPSDRNHILVGRSIDAQLFLSADGGFSWTRVLGPLGKDEWDERRAIHDIVFTPSNSNIVYAATGIETKKLGVSKDRTGPGMFKSMDGGETWEALNNGLENTTLSFNTVAVNPQDPNIVYVGEINSGVYKSTNGGGSWSPVSNGLKIKDIRALAIDPHNPETLYAGVEGGGIWKSEGGGSSWKNVSGGMPAEAAVRAIVIDPIQPNVVYASDVRSGVYRSVDNGETWLQINNGLNVRFIHDLVISSDGRILYAASDGRGVYRLDIDGEPPKAVPEITIEQYLGIENSPIQVNGQADDWADRVVLHEDPSGDAPEGLLDLTTGYAFVDESALYFLIDVVDAKTVYEQIDIILNAGTKRFNCTIVLGNNTAHCGDMMGFETEVPPAVFSSFSIGASFEGRLDLRDLGLPETVQLEEIIVWTGECCEADWIQADSWRPTKPTPSEEESLITLEADTQVENQSTATEPVAEETPAEQQTSQMPILWIGGAVLLVVLLVGAWAMGRRSKG